MYHCKISQTIWQLYCHSMCINRQWSIGQKGDYTKSIGLNNGWKIVKCSSGGITREFTPLVKLVISAMGEIHVE